MLDSCERDGDSVRLDDDSRLVMVFFTARPVRRRPMNRASGWRGCTPARHKVLTTYRSYHGATQARSR
jgi:hypothetical protein